MDINFTLDEVLMLVQGVARSGVTKLELENDDCRLLIENSGTRQADGAPAAYAAAAAKQPGPQESAGGAREADGSGKPLDGVVASPIVGTFYAAASPDDEPFVTVGSRVEKGDVLFIVESMKLMNEVLCETAGTVAEIYAQNEQALEYGQPVMRIV